MRNPLLLAVPAVLALMPVAAHAQNGSAAPTGAEAQPTPEQIETIQRAFRIERAFGAAFDVEGVSDAVKGQLLLCLYNKGLRTITAETEQVFANNAELDSSEATDLYRVAAGVCGVVFRRNAPEGTPPARGPGSADPESGR